MKDYSKIEDITEEYIIHLQKMIRTKKDFHDIASRAQQYSLSLDCVCGAKTPGVESFVDKKVSKRMLRHYEDQKKRNDALYFNETVELLNVVKNWNEKANLTDTSVAKKFGTSVLKVRAVRLPRNPGLNKNKEFCKKYLESSGTLELLCVALNSCSIDVREALFVDEHNVQHIRKELSK